ncbi:MAG: AAA family ATPase [Pseudonocardia sp.]|nr:AAA family ATPase [Pseudonocardia sp.]
MGAVSGMEGLGLSMRAGEKALPDDVRAIFGQLRYPERDLEGSTERNPIYLGSKPRKFRTAAQIVADALKREPGASAERRFEIEVSAKRETRNPTAYYDVTFSPVKSLSLYYTALLAAGDVEGAELVRESHNEAIRIAVASVEEDLAYVRTGRHEGKGPSGRTVGQWERSTGLSIAVYAHHTNRDGEPQLHAHAAVLARSSTEDGRVYAIDGLGFRPIKDSLTAAYTRAYQQLVTERLEVLWELRADGKAREIAGFDRDLLAEGSSRTNEHVRPRVAELVEAYIDRHGREPGPRARRALVEQAVKDTREPKSGVAGPAAVEAWVDQSPGRRGRLAAALDAADEAVVTAAMNGTLPTSAGRELGWEVAVSGRQAALDLLAEIEAGYAVSGHGESPDMAGDGSVATAVSGADTGADVGSSTLAGQVAAAMTMGVADVQAQYATWTFGNLAKAIDNRLGDHASALGLPAAERPAFLAAVTEAALDPRNRHGIVQVSAGDPVPVPDELRRLDEGGDGRSKYRAHMDERYATTAAISAEEGLLATTRTSGAARISTAEAAMVAERGAELGLSEDQVVVVTGVLSSGRGADVLVGPPGTGKSHTMGVLAQAWNAEVGGRVLGVATAQIAARNLAGLGIEARNTRQFLTAFLPDEATGVVRERLGPRDLVVVDEAGMSSTADLVAIADLAAAAGAKVLYAGDHHQLQPVGAGGMFAYLAEQPTALSLDTVHRFAEEWEAEASLQLRAGDPAAAAAYGDHGRLRSGTLEEMKALAVQGHLTDMLDGKKALLIVQSNQLASELSQRIHDRLVELGRVEPGVLQTLPDGTDIAVGDLIQATVNNYRVRVDAGPDGTAFPATNKERYEVIGRDADGALLARDERGAVAHLPREYVQDSVTLAYAVTRNASQGLTVDVARGLVDGSTTRQQALVPMTRGTEMNLLYLETHRAPDAHDPQRVEDTPAQQFADIIAHSDVDEAAVTVRETAAREEASLAMLGALINQAGGEAVHNHNAQLLDELLSEDQAATIRGEGAYGRLLGAVRAAELAGHDPQAVLAEAVQMRGFAGVNSISRVLHWRVETRASVREPENTVLGSGWRAPAQNLPEGRVRDYLAALGDLAHERQDELGRQAAVEPPLWAQQRLPQVPDADTEPEARAAWEQRAGVIAGYREYRGIPDHQTSLGEAPPAAQQFPRALWLAAVEQLDDDPATAEWRRRDDTDLYQAREKWALALHHADEHGPRSVAEELAVTHQLAGDIRSDAIIAHAEADVLPTDDPRRRELAGKAQRHQDLAQRYLDDARALETQHTARQQWWDQVAPLREADQAAADELARRGLPTWRGPQTEPANAGEQLPLIEMTRTDSEPADTEPADTALSVAEPGPDPSPPLVAEATTGGAEAPDVESGSTEIAGGEVFDGHTSRVEIGDAAVSAPESPEAQLPAESVPDLTPAARPEPAEAADRDALDESSGPDAAEARPSVEESLAEGSAGLRDLRESAHQARVEAAREQPGAARSEQERQVQAGYDARAEADQVHTEAERRGQESDREQAPNLEHEIESGYDDDLDYDDY